MYFSLFTLSNQVFILLNVVSLAASPKEPDATKSRTVTKSLSSLVGFCSDKYLFNQFIEVDILPSFKYIKQKNKLVFFESFFKALFTSLSVPSS